MFEGLLRLPLTLRYPLVDGVSEPVECLMRGLHVGDLVQTGDARHTGPEIRPAITPSVQPMLPGDYISKWAEFPGSPTDACLISSRVGPVGLVSLLSSHGDVSSSFMNKQPVRVLPLARFGAQKPCPGPVGRYFSMYFLLDGNSGGKFSSHRRDM